MNLLQGKSLYLKKWLQAGKWRAAVPTTTGLGLLMVLQPSAYICKKQGSLLFFGQPYSTEEAENT